MKVHEKKLKASGGLLHKYLLHKVSASQTATIPQLGVEAVRIRHERCGS